MMDLEKLGLSAEQIAAINEQVEAQTAGLKAKNDELLNEKKTAQQLADEANQSVADKQAALQQAEEEKLKMAGDIDGLKAHYEKQNAEALAQANQSAEQAKELIKQRDTNEAKATILSKVNPDFKDFADALLTQNLTVSYNDKGELVKEFNTNDGVVSSEADFLSWASEKSEAWQRVLLAANSSGGGTQQTKFNGATKSYGEMSLEERAAHNTKVN